MDSTTEDIDRDEGVHDFKLESVFVHSNMGWQILISYHKHHYYDDHHDLV